jgi:hypothetical protein
VRSFIHLLIAALLLTSSTSFARAFAENSHLAPSVLAPKTASGVSRLEGLANVGGERLQLPETHQEIGEVFDATASVSVIWVHNNSGCGPTVVDTFDWVDPTNPAKGILAELDEYGTVKFMIEAGQGASKSGTDMLHMAMSKFGDRVTGIQAIWKYGDNLKAFNNAVSGGSDLRAAAMATWTARRAKSYGFAAPQVLKAAKGVDGKFRDVSVLFLRGDL